MPIYVYPQGPSAPISRLKRVDEFTSTVERVNLDTEQVVAQIGETIPLVFCKEVTTENSEGKEVTHGGVWTDPRLIALGLKDDVFSLLYVLTQGRIVNLPIADVKYGSTKLEEIDGHSLCIGYQQIPDCVDIDYVPGGSLGWESTVNSSGPSLRIDQSEENLSTWTSTTTKCIGFSMKLEGFVIVSASSSYVFEQTAILYGANPGTFTMCPSVMLSTCPPTEVQLSKPYNWKDDVSGGAVSADLERLTNGDIQPVGRDQFNCPIYDQAAPLNRRIQWEAYSYRTWSYRVIDVAKPDDDPVRSGTVTAGGTSPVTLTVDGLPPSQYRVEFYDTTAQRTGGPPYYEASFGVPYPGAGEIDIWGTQTQGACNAMVEHQNRILAQYHNTVQTNVAGNETVDINAPTVVERVYDELEFPDAPGGGEVIQAGYRNLTLVGITGTTEALRPVTGPEYFLQLHCFCREGIYVKQQLQNYELGPSNVYSDLVLYLFEQGGMLKTEQIDYKALLYAARFCEQYKLHFNGVLNTTNSAAEWLTRTAPYFLCNPRQVDGEYGLSPVVPIDAQYKVSQDPVTPVMTLTTDDIIQDSYSRQYINAHDRRPVCLVMLFRDQMESGPGQPRTIEVRYPGTAQEGPFETHDMTEFCVSSTHAAYVARYILAKKRYVEHTVELSIGRRGNMLRPGDIVQIDLALDTTEGEGVTDSTMYEIEQIGEGVSGQVNLTLLHFPVDADGVSLIAKDIAAGEVEIS